MRQRWDWRGGVASGGERQLRLAELLNANMKQ